MKQIELKDAVTVTAQTVEAVLQLKEQGYKNISVKQVKDQNEDGELQEMILLDMEKDGKAHEVRLFAKKEEKNGKEEVKVKTKEGKVNG